MSKFIEIPVNGEKCIINLDAIQSVCPLKGGGCEIHFLEGALKSVKTQFPYSELLKLIWV
jgi:hypothetical protein|nr:MAG TPA: Flagellar and Swarming motility protein [Caudoviricetes sp.]